jgi:hypothetical protein
LGEGKPIAVGHVDEHDAESVRGWLDSLAQSMEVKVMVTDDLKTYRAVTKALGVKHQLCQFHVRQWVGRACVNLREKITKEWEWVIDRAQTILKELPENDAKQLFELWLQLLGENGSRAPSFRHETDIISKENSRKNSLSIFSDNSPTVYVTDTSPHNLIHNSG